MREPRTFARLPADTLILDEASMYPMYIYIIDGVFRRFDHFEPMSVARYKAVNGVKEVRRCSLYGYEGACLGDRVE